MCRQAGTLERYAGQELQTIAGKVVEVEAARSTHFMAGHLCVQAKLRKIFAVTCTYTFGPK